MAALLTVTGCTSQLQRRLAASIVAASSPTTVHAIARRSR